MFHTTFFGTVVAAALFAATVSSAAKDQPVPSAGIRVKENDDLKQPGEPTRWPPCNVALSSLGGDRLQLDGQRQLGRAGACLEAPRALAVGKTKTQQPAPPDVNASRKTFWKLSLGFGEVDGDRVRELPGIQTPDEDVEVTYLTFGIRQYVIPVRRTVELVSKQSRIGFFFGAGLGGYDFDSDDEGPGLSIEGGALFRLHEADRYALILELGLAHHYVRISNEWFDFSQPQLGLRLFFGRDTRSGGAEAGKLSKEARRDSG